MNIEYFIAWGHAYLVHFGAWVSLIIAATIHKDGAPEPSRLKGIIISAVALASIAAAFSSHSHAHYLSHFINGGTNGK